MGVLLDSNKMEARLPLGKLTRTKEALHQWSLKKFATLKELQSLISTLQFAVGLWFQAEPFCSALLV